MTDVPIRVLIIDDHVLYRRGLELVLSQEADLVVVGEGGDGTVAVELTLAMSPDVVLMDVRMPRCSGIEACRDIRAAAPNTKILMLTTSDDEQDLFDSIRAGASGYLLKEAPPEDVVAGIRAVAAGQSLIAPTMAKALVTEFASLLRARDAAPAATTANRLTERELEVLRLVAAGKANREIATALFISENTVKNHVRSILEKLGLHSRVEAAMYAVRERLVDHPGGS